jgi:hypothetical protein
MVNDAGMKEEMRRGILVEFALTTTFDANILVNRESGKSPHESKFGVEFENFNNSKNFGEMVVVTKKIQ